MLSGSRFPIEEMQVQFILLAGEHLQRPCVLFLMRAKTMHPARNKRASGAQRADQLQKAVRCH